MTGRDHALLVRMVQASRSLSNIAADARRQRSNEFSGQSLQEAGQVLHALADEMIARADHAGEPVEAGAR